MGEETTNKTPKQKAKEYVVVQSYPTACDCVDCSTPGFPGGSAGRESACNAGDPGSILVPERSPGEGNGNPLQCSCLENRMDRGAWWAAVCGVAKSQTRLRD